MGWGSSDNNWAFHVSLSQKFLSLSIFLHSFLLLFFFLSFFLMYLLFSGGGAGRRTYCVAQDSLDLELTFLLLQPLNTGVAGMATTPGFSLVP